MGVVRGFEVSIVPRGQGRPRFRLLTLKNGKQTVMPYKAKEDIEYEKRIRDAYCNVYPMVKPLENAIKVEIIAFFPIPESSTKKFRTSALNGDIPYTKKPDADNVAKAVLDALNNVAWRDDSQVVSLTVKKDYEPLENDCGISVIIREADCEGKF